MFIYLSKKIAIPNNTNLRCLSWNHEQGYIACGGEDGLLKVLKLDIQSDNKVKGLAAPSNLSMNQTLEGHGGSVEVVVWNMEHMKLTSSDQFGLIIVWTLYKGQWYEEMVNNRNKSVVKDMKWNFDGGKICIIYEDGAVIVGSVDGNRIWGKELKIQLSWVEVRIYNRINLGFFSVNGEIHIYDNNGNFTSKLVNYCCSDTSCVIAGLNWYNGSEGYIEQECHSLVACYDNGKMQLMKSETDENPIIIDTGLSISTVQWNHTGSVLAVGGLQQNQEKETNVVLFYTPFGDHLRTLRIPGKKLADLSWDGDGLRLSLAIDSYIYFANIRPDYKWGYCGNTVVYAFNKPDRQDSSVVFWETKNKECIVKYIKNLLGITAYGDYCLISTKAPDGSGQYVLILSNAIGTPLETKYIDIKPEYAAITDTHIIVASKEAFYSWQFKTPKKLTSLDLAGTSNKRKDNRERLYHIDDVPSGTGERQSDSKRAREKTKDPICCICASSELLIVGRESGTIHRYSLPHLALEMKNMLKCRPYRLSLNCNSTRLAFIDISGILSFFDLDIVSSDGEKGEQLSFERKDVWDMKWAEDRPDLFAMTEKTRMYIFRNMDPEEPITSSGYICKFNDLEVRSVLLDEVFKDPDNPTNNLILDIETRSLRDTRELLAQSEVGIGDSYQFIEENPHPRLWRLLAEYSLSNLDLKIAEKAFVRYLDYQGIQFVKSLHKLDSEKKKLAEISAYFKRFDEAESYYFDMDRRDLAIDMRVKLGDWFRVSQLLKTEGGGGDDNLVRQSHNAIGDYYADRHRWRDAIRQYVVGHNQNRLAECYYMLEDFEGLDNLMNSVPENHPLLAEIGNMFFTVGMCEPAVRSYMKCGKIKMAIDTCVNLNQWDQAVNLARANNMKEIDNLLAKYASHLLEKSKVLNAIELYRKASRHVQAAKLLYQLAKESAAVGNKPMRTKKLYTILCITVLQKLLELKFFSLFVDGDSMDGDTKTMDNAWRGAEAFHFYLLAQRQLYDGQFDAAMKTALHLRDFEDFIDSERVYSLLVLASISNKCYGIASKAFIKLESMESFTDSQRQSYEDLALDIFSRHPPKDIRNNKAECSHCETLIPDYLPVCPNCENNFPICIVTGRPVMSYHFWMCNVCKHKAFEQEIIRLQNCPLCHTPLYNKSQSNLNDSYY
ncbi:uncharacterized protein TRIADDRAFT_50569 [Trichoplax adhaerens]|uniref:Anaphase-promoting complex subunit 4 WD40 domain-containing protein n=1 Tax=Trichoplax adhaerens TaxID=10228 RepID=B3S216_TRIAD|nr:hypothetical protein TRIADDRAFT_50569 [Trichoplax adhaerens]EDV23603.1 hypothetical protein TRIADDRAFT_50569 [Trichoplax adhaerens]|eukprot:XP_002114513.1 hypothetical protein TRIADDRAFT_50569 [Trichoplax adhaerens]